MKANRLLGAALAVGLGLAVTSIATDVDAQAGKGKGKKEAAAPAPAASAPSTKRPIVLSPKGLAWGMNHKQVQAVVEKMLDEVYNERLKKTSPGVKMRAMETELANEKSAFKGSRIDFDKTQINLDGKFKGEYSHLNKESVLVFRWETTETRFFFIQDKLWKVIDERKLGEGSASGKDLKEALAKLEKSLGVPGRVLAADYDKGRPAMEVDWKDVSTHLRIIQRGEDAMGVALEDNVTLGNLSALRSNKPQEEQAIDPAVAAVTRKDEPVGPPPAAEKTKGTKKAPTEKAPAKKQ